VPSDYVSALVSGAAALLDFRNVRDFDGEIVARPLQSKTFEFGSAELRKAIERLDG
jgi:hypothetical protein